MPRISTKPTLSCHNDSNCCHLQVEAMRILGGMPQQEGDRAAMAARIRADNMQPASSHQPPPPPPRKAGVVRVRGTDGAPDFFVNPITSG